jgi:hypothetical protein
LSESRNRRWHRHYDVFGGGEFSLVILQSRDHDLGFSRVGAVDGLAVVPQSLLGESLRVTAGPGPFRPRVAVGMEGDALNHQPAAGAGELGRPVRLPHLPVIGKERPHLRQRPQDGFKLFAKADDRNRAGLVAVEAHDLALPVDILGGERGNVGLSDTEVPAEFVKSPALQVRFVLDDGLMFLPGDGPLLLETDSVPSPLAPPSAGREVVPTRERNRR